MSFKVTRLIVGRGRTTSDEKQSEWNRQYYELEAIIEDEHQLELAKSSLEALLDIWLKGETVAQPSAVAVKPSTVVEKPSYEIEKIRWEQAQGTSGPYEKSTDVNSLDFKALLADVQKHGGKMTVSGYFVWAFQNGATLGRKKRK